jgi:hypothetical protein
VAVVADEDEVVPAEVDADEELDFELPHALTTAATTNKQAANAASLLERMTYLILGSPSRSAAYSPAFPYGPVCSGPRMAAPSAMLTPL